MTLLAAALLFALGAQDDVSRLLEKLRGDNAAEREAAQRSLERAGLSVLDRLKAEAEKESELETRIRLKALIEKIPKLAQLAKVYGPTRRLTYSAKNEKLGTVLEKVGEGLGEKIRGDQIDLEQAVTLELSEATLWEALDRLARASRTHYTYRQDGIRFLPGEAPEMPVVYYEQFRISVVEVKRIDYRSAGEKGKAVIVMPDVMYQRNLSPGGNKFRKVFTLDGIQGPGGADLRVPYPSFVPALTVISRSFVLEEAYFVDPAVETFSIAGKATVNFAQDFRELTLPVGGEPKEESTADGTFRVAGTEAVGLRTTVTLEIEVPDAGGMDDRFRGVWVIDSLGKRHTGTIVRMGRDGKQFRPQLSFGVKSDDVKAVSFRWMTGLHAVEIPFLLKDIKVP